MFISNELQCEQIRLTITHENLKINTKITNSTSFFIWAIYGGRRAAVQGGILAGKPFYRGLGGAGVDATRTRRRIAEGRGGCSDTADVAACKPFLPAG